MKFLFKILIFISTVLPLLILKITVLLTMLILKLKKWNFVNYFLLLIIYILTAESVNYIFNNLNYLIMKALIILLKKKEKT